MFNLHVFYTAKDKATLDRFYDEVRAAGIIEATHEEEEMCIRDRCKGKTVKGGNRPAAIRCEDFCG